MGMVKSSLTSMASGKRKRSLVGIIMGSQSDWPTMKNASDLLEKFGVPYEKKIVSAHRTPHRLVEYAQTASVRGLKVIIAGAGGAAHLPGMTASFTSLPVLGVPVDTHSMKGIDSLLSIAQMPAGIPVGCMAIGVHGAKNAAFLAVAILSLNDETLAQRWKKFRSQQTQAVLKQKL
jgi:5-(carboxyamino)imidazole ribonucleotide mutase